MQAFQASGDSALRLWRLGLEEEECVVFGLVCAGGMIQVVASFLLPGRYVTGSVLSKLGSQRLQTQL